MAVKIINAPPPTPEKKAPKSWYREYKKELFYKQRRELSDELFEELNGDKIPKSIEETLDKACMSPAEILNLYQSTQIKPLGPHQRKYIVANAMARLLGVGKAPGANQYVPEVADLIIEQMSEGRSVNTICKDPYMPSFSKFMYWLQNDPVLKERYEIARRVQVEVLVARLLDESLNPRKGVKVVRKPDGTFETTIEDAIGRSRIATDNIKFLIAKIAPKIYGNNIDGAGGDSNKMVIKVIGGLPDTDIPEGPLEDNENENKLKVLGGLAEDAEGGLPDTPLSE